MKSHKKGFTVVIGWIIAIRNNIKKLHLKLAKQWDYYAYWISHYQDHNLKIIRSASPRLWWCDIWQSFQHISSPKTWIRLIWCNCTIAGARSIKERRRKRASWNKTKSRQNVKRQINDVIKSKQISFEVTHTWYCFTTRKVIFIM